MASLVVIDGPGQGVHFPLSAPLISVGREDTCTLQIVDSFISRKHLQIRFEEGLGRHVASDYRSAHGVFVNDKQILQDTPLHDGDRIRIGQTTLVFLAGEHDPSSAMIAAERKKGEWKRSTLM